MPQTISSTFHQQKSTSVIGAIASVPCMTQLKGLMAVGNAPKVPVQRRYSLTNTVNACTDRLLVRGHNLFIMLSLSLWSHYTHSLQIPFAEKWASQRLKPLKNPSIYLTSYSDSNPQSPAESADDSIFSECLACSLRVTLLFLLILPSLAAFIIFCFTHFNAHLAKIKRKKKKHKTYINGSDWLSVPP